MKCKFCGAELSETDTFCPACGNEIPGTETPETAEEKAAVKSVKRWKRIAVISGCVAVLLVLVLALSAVVVGSINDQSALDTVKGWFDWELFRSNDIYKQDSYTATDKTAQKTGDVVVATYGDAQLTNSQLQMYYQMEVLSFLNNYYYYIYLGYIDMDYTQPLDTQLCGVDDSYTWQQYFIECALESWYQQVAMVDAAEKAGFQLDEEYQTELDELEATWIETVTEAGYDSLDAFFQEQCGANTGFDDYYTYLKNYYTCYAYSDYLYDSFTDVDLSVLEEYYQQNADDIDAEQDGSYSIDVRHILIAVETTGTENEDGSITFSDEEDAEAARLEAELILSMWLKNPTEDYFAELAAEHTDDSNGDDGGLYEDVTEGTMVTSFNDWCFDESREYGDYAIVETKYGYHIMFFVERNEDLWITETRDAYATDKASALITEILSANELEVKFNKIALAYVPLS